jgi:hypothetical protein
MNNKKSTKQELITKNSLDSVKNTKKKLMNKNSLDSVKNTKKKLMNKNYPDSVRSQENFNMIVCLILVIIGFSHPLIDWLLGY